MYTSPSQIASVVGPAFEVASLVIFSSKLSVIIPQPPVVVTSNVKVTKPLSTSKGLGLYVGFKEFGLSKNPVPVVVHSKLVKSGGVIDASLI